MTEGTAKRHWSLSSTGERQPTVSGLLPGLMVGYSVFTTFRAPIPEPFLLLHWQRLKTQSASLEMAFPWTFATLQRAIKDLEPPESETSEAAFLVRLTVVPAWERFTELFSLKEKEALGSHLVLSVEPLPVPAEPEKPLRLLTVQYDRPSPHLKHGNYLESFRHRREAALQGYDDVVWVNAKGHLTEASTSNFFCVKENRLYTPDPERDGCLFGITRFQVVRQAEAVGWSLAPDPLTPDMMATMEGAFLSNAVQGLRRAETVGEQVMPWPETALSAFSDLTSRIYPAATGSEK